MKWNEMKCKKVINDMGVNLMNMYCEVLHGCVTNWIWVDKIWSDLILD